MKIFTPATSANLGPGFDSLGIAIKLYNEVEITKQSFTSISVDGFGSAQSNLKQKNPFINIFNEFYSSLNPEKSNFKFHFTNNIPFSRGLGSSSSVIIGAIGAAYEMAGFKIQKSTILNKALFYESHPDNISPAVYGGFTANILKNGEVLTQRAELDENLRAVMVIPDQPISTEKSRQALPKNYSKADCVSNLSHAAFLTACFIKKDYQMLKFASIDKMHEDYRINLLPELFEVRKIAYENGSLMSVLSGSGSSFLNLIYKDDAQKLKSVLSNKFTKFAVEIYELDNNGFTIQS